MVGRLLRVTSTVLVIAVAFAIPVLVTSPPASADTVVNGCTIVSNPTSTDFTNCPGADLSGANLSGVDLSFANLAGATFADCPVGVTTCTLAGLSGATLTDANLSNAVFAAVGEYTDPALGCPPLNVIQFCTVGTAAAAAMTGVNLSGADLSDDVLTATSPFPLGSGTTATVNLTGATLSGANFTGTAPVPSDQTLTTPGPAHKGVVVFWPPPGATPPSVPGATLGSCTPSSGSTFPVGTTTVTCQVLDNQGDVATGTFTVVVTVVKSHGHK